MTGKYLPLLSFSIILALASGQGCPTDTGSNNNQDTTGDQTNTGDNGGTDNTNNPDNGGDDTPTSNALQVDIDEYAFVPKSITIRAGQTVKWTNRQFTPHRVRSGDPEDEDKGDLFRSESLGMNKSFEHTFATPGEYEYHCEYYYSREDMRDAKVIVTE